MTARQHVTHALFVVLAIIGLSLLASTLQVVDVAISGALLDLPMISNTAAAPRVDRGSTIDASLIELPAASVDALSL